VRRIQRYEDARSVAAAVAAPGRKVASLLACERYENEEDANGVDDARERSREAACGEDAEEEVDEDRKERAGVERDRRNEVGRQHEEKPT
jgi:hypothetical protein